MDIHPWTKYEIARIRDEERLLRARAARQAREFRATDTDDVGAAAPGLGSWIDRLRRRAPVVDQASVRARPV